jgi:hypothetical protein
VDDQSDPYNPNDFHRTELRLRKKSAIAARLEIAEAAGVSLTPLCRRWIKSFETEVP